jgi:phosphatidylglycerophosphatase A
MPKPWPTNYFDRKYTGGFGIMIDDQVAAVQTTIAFYAIFFAMKYFGYLDSLITIE